MKKQLARIEKAHSKYMGEVGHLEAMMADKIKFEFGIEHLPDDGLCIINVGSASLAPIYECIQFLNKHGSMDKDQHDNMCI